MHIADEDHRAILAWAERHDEIAEVWLYGSRARGDHRTDSDLDLAVVVVGKSVAERQVIWMFAGWKNDLSLSCPVHLEWFDFDAAREFEAVGPGVMSEGVLLFRR
jgi:predicted nucleotidyltransferase